MSRLNPSVLRKLADASGGRFIDGSTRPDLGMSDVESTLNGLEKRQFETRIRKQRIDRSEWSIGFALVFLLAAAFWPERFQRPSDRKRGERARTETKARMGERAA